MSVPREPPLLPPAGEEEVFFKTYIPPARDAITLPIHVFYIILASIVIVATLYAIIGHLIKDLMHDLADSMFGPQPEEIQINLCEARDKFMADWSPETSPELEALARAEEMSAGLEGARAPAVWVLSDGTGPRAPRAGPRVAFGKNV